jgi:PAS domain-containing protein
MPELLETVLAALDAGVVIHGADTAIIEANNRARELLGLHDLDGRLAGDPAWVFLEPDGSRMPLERFPVMQEHDRSSTRWS